MIARILVAFFGLVLAVAGATVGVMWAFALLGVFIPDHVWSIGQTAWFLQDALEALIIAPMLAYAAGRLGVAVVLGSWDDWRLSRTRQHAR